MKSSHRLVYSALVAGGALLAGANAQAREPETPVATLSEIDAAALIEAAGGGYSIDEQTGHVVNVGMGRRQLEPLLDELAVLQNLRTLALHDTTLTNDLVKRLPALPQLEVLILSGCGRRITDAAFADMQRFPRLQRLELAGTGVQGHFADELSELELPLELDLERTRLTDAGLARVAAIPTLEVLFASETTVTDEGLQALGACRSLKRLYLSATRIRGGNVEAIAGLSELETLVLYSNRIDDRIMPHLRGLTNLRVLGLSNTQITDAGLSALAGLTQLDELFISDCEITDRGLASLAPLKQLTWLSLTETGITDAGLRHLVGMTQLEMLFVEDTHVTERGYSALKEHLPKCEIRPFDAP